MCATGFSKRGVGFPSTVEKSFKVMGISNDFDGTGDDLIWDRGEVEDVKSKEEDEGEE